MIQNPTPKIKNESVQEGKWLYTSIKNRKRDPKFEERLVAMSKFWLEGLTIKEIAQKMNMPYDITKAAIYWAKNRKGEHGLGDRKMFPKRPKK